MARPTSSSSRRPPASPTIRGTTARWPGAADDRPRTDAEYTLRRWRQQLLIRFLVGWVGVPLLLTYLLAPTWLLPRLAQYLTEVPGGLTVLWVLLAAYPFVQLGVVGVLGVLILHLTLAAVLVPLQQYHRRRTPYHTLALDLSLTEQPGPLHGMAFFVGLQRLAHAHGRVQGREATLVCSIVQGDDGLAQFRVRAPVRTDQDGLALLRDQITGRWPGTTTRLREQDDLQAAITQAATPPLSGGPRALASLDLTLCHHASYPLNDVSGLLDESLGPLLVALQHRPGVQYAAYELILRGVEPRWRIPVRMQVAQIQARLSPDDLGGHDALLRTLDQAVYDVVVRCVVIADTAPQARAVVQQLAQALGQFDHTTRGHRQALRSPRIDVVRGGMRGRVVPLPPPDQATWSPTRREWLQASGWTLLGGLVGLLLGSPLGASGMDVLRHVLWQHLPALTGGVLYRPPFPSWLVPLLLTGLGGAVGGLSAWAWTPRRRAWRTWQQLQLLAAHAHRYAWPGRSWGLPVPGYQRSVLGAHTLAALFHQPDLTMHPYVTTRSLPPLPAPAWAFLDDEHNQEHL
ncbi:MAG: hypothetical protein HC828_06765 [Blastochloris sp.]|nr:hypothetical protein [Blastochloris sp.]